MITILFCIFQTDAKNSTDIDISPLSDSSMATTRISNENINQRTHLLKECKQLLWMQNTSRELLRKYNIINDI